MAEEAFKVSLLYRGIRQAQGLFSLFPLSITTLSDNILHILIYFTLGLSFGLRQKDCWMRISGEGEQGFTEKP